MEGFLDTTAYALFQSAILLIVIAVWGFWKYRERELFHKQAMIDIARDRVPHRHGGASWGRIFTTALVFVILLAAVIRGNELLIKMVGFFDNPLTYMSYPVLVELSLIAVLFLMIIIRDSRSLLRKG